MNRTGGDILNDRRAQLLLLSGILIAMSVALISLYLTTASISGYRVSYSPWDLPYYEMRMSVYEATRAIKYYYSKNPALTEQHVQEFYQNMSKIYARHGYFVVAQANKTASDLYWLNLTFKTDRVNLEVKKNVPTY